MIERGEKREGKGGVQRNELKERTKNKRRR